MNYDIKLADRVRQYLITIPDIDIEEKKMFRGLTFMVNNKMCVSVSGKNLMCRFDPELQDKVAGRKGFQTMIMKGSVYKGYCYVSPEGIQTIKDFEFWVNLCLDFNGKAKSSKHKQAVKKNTKTKN
jgi:hypothetical protein